jgi:hypothetical protein
MNIGVYFSCFMRKKTKFSQVLQLAVYKSIFIYLEFHFTVKTKLVKNFVSFLLSIFQIIFIEI